LFGGFYGSYIYDDQIKVNVYLGIGDIDRSKNEYWNPSTYGELVRDTEFDASDPSQ